VPTAAATRQEKARNQLSRGVAFTISTWPLGGYPQPYARRKCSNATWTPGLQWQRSGRPSGRNPPRPKGLHAGPSRSPRTGARAGAAPGLARATGPRRGVRAGTARPGTLQGSVLWRGPVRHQPWLLFAASVTDLHEDLSAAAGCGRSADRTSATGVRASRSRSSTSALRRVADIRRVAS